MVPRAYQKKTRWLPRLSTACNLATTAQIQPQSDSRTNNCMREIVKAYTGKDTRLTCRSIVACMFSHPIGHMLATFWLLYVS